MRKPLQILAVVAASFASPATAAVDSCMVGTWWADISDLADMLGLQMNGAARAMGGDVRMDVAGDGGFRITVRNLVINMQMPNAPAVDVTVTGYSAGNFDAAGNVWTAFVGDYSLTGSADVLGQPLSIPFTSASGMFGGGLGNYNCSSSTLRLETDPAHPMQMVRTWQRG